MKHIILFLAIVSGAASLLFSTAAEKRPPGRIGRARCARQRGRCVNGHVPGVSRSHIDGALDHAGGHVVIRQLRGL
jgi:hypothetical protein